MAAYETLAIEAARGGAMKLGQLLFNPSGRVGRRAFGFGLLAMGVLLTPAVLAARAGAAWPAAIIGLAALYVLVCLSAKRLRDAGHAPWLQLLPWVLAIIPAVADSLMWAGRHATGLGGLAGPLVLSISPGMLIWFVIVFTAWLGLSRPKAPQGSA